MEFDITPQMTSDKIEKALKEYYKYLHENWKHWFLLQLKQSMISGKKNIFLNVLDSKTYKKFRTILNFWKPLPTKYYDKITNIYITDEKIRELIDYIESIGLKWGVTIYWDSSNIVSMRYYTLYVQWSHFTLQ